VVRYDIDTRFNPTLLCQMACYDSSNVCLSVHYPKERVNSGGCGSSDLHQSDDDRARGLGGTSGRRGGGGGGGGGRPLDPDHDNVCRLARMALDVQSLMVKLADIAYHVILHVSGPRFLSHMASHNVASVLCLALDNGGVPSSGWRAPRGARWLTHGREVAENNVSTNVTMDRRLTAIRTRVIASWSAGDQKPCPRVDMMSN